MERKKERKMYLFSQYRYSTCTQKCHYSCIQWIILLQVGRYYSHCFLSNASTLETHTTPNVLSAGQ